MAKQTLPDHAHTSPQTVLADPLPQTPLQPVPGPTILTDSSSQQLGFVPRVQEFTLPNGLHFIVLPRSVAPVASVHVLANVGAYQEEEGQTGVCLSLYTHHSMCEALNAPCVRVSMPFVCKAQAGMCVYVCMCVRPHLMQA